MNNIILAEPTTLALFGLGLIFLFLLALIVFAGGILVFLLRKPKNTSTPLQTSPPLGASQKCPKCGATMPQDSPEGLCPRCLVAMNLATQTEVPGDQKTPKSPPEPPLPVDDVAKLFPQLEILECLGRGGMGAVYKVRQPRLDRVVALKIISPEKQGNQKFADRFEREARALAKLHHPNIVTVYDFGEVQGNFYLLMEFVDGLTLRQLLQTRKLSPPEALAIVPKICEALQYAHGQGIVHRDIKPENILMDKAGHVKIADFGIAKIIGDGGSSNLTEEQTIGTPHYMSPEQIEKPQTVDHRADIYSLGVVFYEMLTGELPLGKFQPPSKKVHIDVRLDEVVLRALEKEPDRRYQQASEVKTRVETIAQTVNTETRQEHPLVAAVQKPDRFWRWFAVTVLALIAIPFVLSIIGMLAAIAIPNFVKARQRSLALYQQQIAANAETWSPTLAPGEKPNLHEILDSAQSLMQEGSYEEALQHYLWYFDHSRNDASQRGVRLSFALSDWIELGHRYPKAKQALIEIRDADVRQFSEGNGYADLFQEIAGINQYLNDDDATVALFQSIGKSDPRLAAQCFLYAENLLVQKGDYELCRQYLGDPQAAFERIRQTWQMTKQFEERNAARSDEQKERLQAMAKTNSLFAHMPVLPAPPPFADNNFVQQTRQLIEILVATGSKPDAENIQKQAMALLDDSRLKSAVSDAETKIGEQNSAGQSEPADLREARAKLAELRAVKGEQNPEVQQALARVNALEQMTKDEPNLPPDLREAKAHLAELRVVYGEQNPVVLQALAQVKALEESSASQSAASETSSQTITDQQAARRICINNLRRIDAAKNVWALEYGKTNGDVPTVDDLKPYLDGFPVCPSGGTYSINPLGELPTCSVPGHALPGTSPTNQSTATVHTETKAIQAALSWLTLIDAGNYSESWNQAAAIFRGSVTEADWEKSMNTFRNPLGSLISRKPLSAIKYSQMPGAPDGQYVVMQFQTSFANKASAIETVTFSFEKDGQWRCSGYFIK